MNEEVTTQVVEMTPELAGHLLERNTGNRPLRKAWARHLGDAMKQRQFPLNGESIIIGADGVIISGQHRLEGCVLSGATFKTVLVEGIANEAFATVDCGKVRSMGDVLAIMGVDNPTAIAASLKLVDLISTRSLGKGGSSFGTHRNYEASSLLDAYPGISASARVINGFRRPIGIPQACLIAGHYLCLSAAEHHTPVNHFFRIVCTGEDAEFRSPAFQYREKVARRYCSGDRLGRYYIMSGMFKAWNLYRKNKTVKNLVFPTNGDPEKLPLPI